MNADGLPCSMIHWAYGPPPTALDLVRNTPFWRVLRIALHAILRLWLRLFHGCRPRDSAELQGLHGRLIVANHSSHLDFLVLFSAFPLMKVNAIRSLCAKDYFFSHPLKGMIAFLLANTIPMDRGRFDSRAIAYCRRRMEQGDNIIMFPEGTRSGDGRMAPFKAGVGLLALKYGWPILPAMLCGTHQCLPKGAMLPRPGKIATVFGRTVRYRGSARGRHYWLRVAHDLEQRVRRLERCAAKDMVTHENASDKAVEDVRPHCGAIERRRPHRLRRRPDIRQDRGLRLPQPAIGPAADRQAV